MQIEQNNQQGENEKVFLDYLGRQSIIDHTQFALDIDEYRKQNPKAAHQIIKDPTKYYRLMKKYLEQHQKQVEPTKNKIQSKLEHFNIKIQGNLGSNFVTPRGLSSRMANQLVGLQGIITKIDLPKKYLQKSVHYCEKTKTFEIRQYPDSFNPQKDVELHLKRNIIQFDNEKNPLSFQYGFSTFKNMEMAVIQQLPEMAPPGLLPMSVQVVLQNKLVNSVKPGDRVQLIGIYKLITGHVSKQKGIFKPYFLCLSVKPLTPVLTLLKRPSKTDFPQDQIFNIFSRSIAPSIWGHQFLKKAVLLMLVGGVEKVTPNNTHLRGDINILMVGDPGTAKSQMLRWVLSTVDVSVGTTGSGASGVGLTAAIVTDRQTGEKTLEAGAMVLADRGVVCIDQFDKMNQTDRVAVHEVMEQQTVTIAKAGLHCSLNARCAVIAAANPIYGQYQQSMPPNKNVGMPDSLLSRFDLIFIILDHKNPERDYQIAEKVCRNHRLAPQSNQMNNQYMDSTQYVVTPLADKKEDEGIYEKNNVYKTEGKNDLVTQTFLKRYINWVKYNFEPKMSNKAISLCAQLWTLIREKDANNRQDFQTKVLPITIRSLESLIRLSTAHAKLRQSYDVEIVDVLQGFKLMMYCLYRDNQDALQDQTNQILKRMDVQDQYFFGKKNKNRQIREPKEEQLQKIKEEKDGISKKMEKLNLQKIEEDANEIIQRYKGKTKNQKHALHVDVWKTMIEIKKKKRVKSEGVLISQIYDALRLAKKEMSRQIIQLIVEELIQEKGDVYKQGEAVHF